MDNQIVVGGEKPPSLSNGLAFAHRRIDILREVCESLVMELVPEKRATKLALLAIVMDESNG